MSNDTPTPQVKAITHDDYLKLIGLLKLADDHRKHMAWIAQSALTITGETEAYGHTGDAIWSDGEDADSLLKKLSISILPPKEAATALNNDEY